MKVLIIGASGFIGITAAQAFVRAGHQVYGQTRSQAKTKPLIVEEIIPVVGDLDDISSWISIAAAMDVVIDASGGSDIQANSAIILNAVSDVAQKLRPAHAVKLTFIYTSGTWVHGDNHKDVVTDTTPAVANVELVAWRSDQEQRTIKHPVLNGIVIRPSLLYGRSGSLLDPLFRSAHEGKVKWFGTPDDRYAFVHADDLANFYVLAAEKAILVGGQIFDAANDFTENADDLMRRLAEVSGAQGYEYVRASNLYETALVTTTLLRPYLGRALLGWQPRKAGLVDNLQVYYDAWKTSVGL